MGRARAVLHVGQMLAEGRHLLPHLAEALIAVLQALHPQADFVDQSRGPAAAQGQAATGLPAAGNRLAAVHDHPEVVLVPLQEVFQGPPIGFDPPQQPSGHARIAERNIDGLLEPHAAREHVVQDAQGRSQDVVAFQDRTPQVPPRPLDAPRRGQFLAAGEQGNVTHLHQVRADRPRLIFLHCCLLRKDPPWRKFTLDRLFLSATRLARKMRPVTCDACDRRLRTYLLRKQALILFTGPNIILLSKAADTRRTSPGYDSR